MKFSSFKIPPKGLGAALFLLAAIGYVTTAGQGVVPPPTAVVMAGHAGLEASRQILNPVWGLLIEAVSGLGASETLPNRANLLSLPFAAFAVWLMYVLMAGVTHDRSGEEVIGRADRRRAQVMSGWAAALTLGVAPPFWFAATNADPAALHAFLLLGCVWLNRWAGSGDRMGRYLVWAAAFGFAAAEFATLWFVAPVFAFTTLLALWRNRVLTVVNVLLIGGAVVAGWALILPVLWRYWLSPEAMEFVAVGSFPQLVWAYFKGQLLLLLRGTPRVGWLMVLLFSVLPWFLIVGARPGQADTGIRQTGSIFLHLVTTAVGVLIVLNELVAPFQLFGLQPLMVTPYLFVASWFGYLVGYWYILCTRETGLREPIWDPIRRLLGPLLLPAFAALIVVAAVMNYPAIGPNQARPMVEAAEWIVDSLEGRRWLVTNGVLDGNILIAAHQRGVELELLNARRFSRRAYRETISRQFDQPRLRSMALVGLGPLLEEWNRISPAMADEVAILHHGDIWYRLGRRPIPHGAVFLGAAAQADVSAASMSVSRRLETMQGLGEQLNRIPERTPPLDRYAAWTRTHVGKMANNLGVMLEEEGEVVQAAEAYRTARRVNPDNVSALLNLTQVAARQEVPDRDAIQADFEDFAAGLRAKLRVWSLAYQDGYVRNPLAFVEQGWAWAMSGQPNAGIQGIQQAIELGAPEEPLQAALASLHAQSGDQAQSEALYIRVLERDPNDLSALHGLARAAMRRQHFDEARNYVERMREAGASPVMLRQELAGLELLLGNAETARRLLRENLEEQPEHERSLVLLTALALHQGDVEEQAALVARLRSLKQPSAAVQLTLAHVAQAEQDWDRTRDHLEAILTRQPNHRPALQGLLRLAYLQRDPRQAERYVHRLLEVDPSDALANLMLGGLQYARRELDLAESSYRASIAARPSASALNDLAWILKEKGELEEALARVEEALALNPAHGHSYDTKGMILYELGRLEEAEGCLVKAVERIPHVPQVLFHLATVYGELGRREDAVALLDNLTANASRLPTDILEQASDLRRRLQSGR